MKTTSYFFITLSFIVASITSWAQRPDKDPNWYISWIDRPWEYRYLLYVDRKSYFETHRKAPIHKNKYEPGFSYYVDPSPFPASWYVTSKSIYNEKKHDQFAVLRINIQPDRLVTTPSDLNEALEARLNWHEQIVLAPRHPQPNYIIQFGAFFMGSYAASDTRYSPSICHRNFGDTTNPRDTSGRYGEEDYDPDLRGYFGCREWAAQLYDSTRPYIDVTSYEQKVDNDLPELTEGPRKGRKPLVDPPKGVTYIHSFVGFSRFGDAPKPVIGNHMGEWLCLNDCPNGDKPGIIRNIKQWAARNHWPVPTPPEDVREFMDKKGEEMEFID